MDIATIDSQYNQLQSQAQQTIGELKDLAQKLQSAAAAGNQDAREWLLDLKSIALAIQAEQNQVSNLLQSIHNFADSQQRAMPLPQQPARASVQRSGPGNAKYANRESSLFKYRRAGFGSGAASIWFCLRMAAIYTGALAPRPRIQAILGVWLTSATRTLKFSLRASRLPSASPRWALRSPVT